MNLCEAVALGRERNLAIRRPAWPIGMYVYHGTDNVLRDSGTNDPLPMSVVALLAGDWELSPVANYHGPLAESEDYFKEWTTAFFGKGGISLKRGWDGVGSKAEAEAEAEKNCNCFALPLCLFKHVKEIEERMVVAERELRENRVRREIDRFG